MKLKVKTNVPPGSYRAEFLGVEETTHDDYGEGLVWSWEILTGSQKGQQVFRTTKPMATAKNSAGKFLVALTGLPLKQAATKDIDEYVGKRHHVIVEMADSGSTRVGTFVPDAEPEPDPAPARASEDQTTFNKF